MGFPRVHRFNNRLEHSSIFCGVGNGKGLKCHILDSQACISDLVFNSSQSTAYQFLDWIVYYCVWFAGGVDCLLFLLQF